MHMSYNTGILCICHTVYYMPTFVQFLFITVNFWLAQVTLSWQIINLLPSKLVPWRFLFARHAHAREIPATNVEVRMRSVLYRKLYLYTFNAEVVLYFTGSFTECVRSVATSVACVRMY